MKKTVILAAMIGAAQGWAATDCAATERRGVRLWKDGPEWAECNIGAERPEASGWFFWWGDTVGCRRAGNAWVANDGSNANFSFNNDDATFLDIYMSVYALEIYGKVADGVLAPEHDAAAVCWGGGWRMPTRQELEALTANCDWRWTQLNGMNGYRVTGRGEFADAAIFLPAAGMARRTGLEHVGGAGFYWSATPFKRGDFRAGMLYFNLARRFVNSDYHRFGLPVRAVRNDLRVASPIAGQPSQLEAGFKEPPGEAKPQTWYHMMNENVTKEGITRDFEEIAKAGLGGVQMFDAGCDIPPGGLDFDSPAWYDMLKHAAKEARRLGLEICLPNCSGWSSSGGPWNMPSNAMKRVVTREVKVKGPQVYRAKLPRETNDNGFYADIGVFAFPTPPADSATFEGVRVKTAKHGFTFESDTPFELSGFSMEMTCPGNWSADADAVVEVSDDGQVFRPLEQFHIPLYYQSGYLARNYFHVLPKRMKVRALKVSVAHPSLNIAVKAARPELRTRISDFGAKTFQRRAAVTIDRAEAAADQTVARDAVIDITDKMKPDGTLDWEVPPGAWTILRAAYVCNGVPNHPASDHGVGLEVDKLSAEAMNYHFERYIGRVCRELGGLAGAVAFGFNNVLVDSFEVGSQNWTQKMEVEFARRAGYSIRPWMPAFAGYAVGSVAETERFLEDFRRVVADMFAENYAGALTAKCHQYGLQCSIEPYGGCPSDNMQYGRHCDIPMAEFWSRARKPYLPAIGGMKNAASIAHVWGRRFCATESFTASPQKDEGRWLTTPFSIKVAGDSAYAKGVNRIIYHRFTHQPWADDKYLPGMTMGRWGMHLDRTQTWWDFAGGWFKYQARCQYLLQQGEFCADVLYYQGEHAPNAWGDSNGNEALRAFFKCPDGYDWDLCDVEALRALKVDGGRAVTPGGTRYRVVVLPPMEAVSPDVVAAVARLADAGVAVVWPEKPTRAPGLRWGLDADAQVRAAADALWATGKVHARVADAISAAGVEQDVRVTQWGGDAVRHFSWLHRRSAEADWYFLAMPNREERTVEVSFRQTGRVPELWDAETGECEPAASWRMEGGRTVVSVPFTVCGSKFVVFRRSSVSRVGNSRSQLSCQPMEEIKIEGAWTVWFPNGYLPNKMAKGAEERVEFAELKSWSEHETAGVRYFSGTARYEKTIARGTLAAAAARAKAGGRVMLDLGEVREFAEVTVNGRTYPALWKPPFRVDITDAVKGGGDLRLSVRVTNLWANRLIGDDIEHADDCEWKGGVVNGVKEMGIKAIPDWVKSGKPSPTGRCTFTTWKHWDKHDALLPSGILGPVTVR